MRLRQVRCGVSAKPPNAPRINLLLPPLPAKQVPLAQPQPPLPNPVAPLLQARPLQALLDRTLAAPLQQLPVLRVQAVSQFQHFGNHDLVIVTQFQLVE